ncbi:hypothetical protein EMCRGX_G024103 [Ephydatia muelleri]
MALAMALTRVIFSLPNMSLSLITLALRNEEEPKAKRVASRVKVLLASSPQLHFSSSTHPPTCLSQNSRSKRRCDCDVKGSRLALCPVPH